MRNSVDLLEALHRNGIILERARLGRRPLEAIERNIIYGGRLYASGHGYSTRMIIATEMEGERDFSSVRRPLKVVARFAYYHDPIEDVPATASYLVTQSNYAGFAEGSNVDGKQLTDVGFKLPKTPTYQKWVNAGRPCYRGVES